MDEDFISNVTDEDDELIVRLEYSTLIRCRIKIDGFGEDEMTISSEQNEIILDELYNIYVLEKTLVDQEVVTNTDVKIDDKDLHPIFTKSTDMIFDVILKMKNEIYRFEWDRGNLNAQDVTMKKLRFILVTMIQVYLTQFTTYEYIIKRYGSILRKIFIEIWGSVLLEEQQFFIDEARKSNRNVVRRPSDKVPLKVPAVYISKDNRIIKAMVFYPKQYYLIDVLNFTCDCPDFMYRKYSQGLICKHLLKFQNECKCMMVMNSVIQEHLYNVPCPVKEMLRVAYDSRTDFAL